MVTFLQFLCWIVLKVLENAVVRCIITPSFIKIQSAASVDLYCMWHFWQIVCIMGGVCSLVILYSYGLDVSHSLVWAYVIVASLWGTKDGNFWCNFRTLDWNACICARKHWLTPTIWTLCFKSPFSISMGAILHLTESKGTAEEEGGVPAGSRWCVCLLNASTCSVSVDLWPCHRWPGFPTGRGSEGTMVPCTDGQLVLLNPATHQLKKRVAHTHAHSTLGTVMYTFLARQPAQMPMQDNPVGIDASLSEFENKSGEEQGVNMRKLWRNGKKMYHFALK